MSLRSRVFAGLSALGFLVLLYLQLAPDLDWRVADGIGCAVGSVMAIGAAVATQIEWSRSKRGRARAVTAATAVPADTTPPDSATAPGAPPEPDATGEPERD
ncbi:hypothetical protein QEZ54_10395 [Catellatospora sp. KI3]|uniref:hypothetical protein n=1 Tax=Catellatospora sp. KI3 TaxID=3041620 RepID=UPI0024822DAA|nr:hypothetical protein [Catellatospora sp. KI3]MDI1461378.1 hypothetical protein [Catellatospora sp. KI3]